MVSVGTFGHSAQWGLDLGPEVSRPLTALFTQGRVGSYIISPVDRASKGLEPHLVPSIRGGHKTIDTELLGSGYCLAPLPSQKPASLSHHCHDALWHPCLAHSISCPPTSGHVVIVPGSLTLQAPPPMAFSCWRRLGADLPAPLWNQGTQEEGP